MTEQMRTLLEMLRAAQADDMPALAEAEARAMRNQQERKRGELTELQSERSHLGAATLFVVADMRGQVVVSLAARNAAVDEVGGAPSHVHTRCGG